MKLTPGFAAISILMGMLGLAACGQNSNQAVYQYPETAVLFDNFHILKTVYTSGEMKLLREKTVRTCPCGAENKGKFCTKCGRPF